jgi:hypothetical protein
VHVRCHLVTSTCTMWLHDTSSYVNCMITYLPRSGSQTMTQGLCPNHILKTGP